MYAGQFVEVASVTDIFAAPRHPYSEALLAATLDLEAEFGAPIPVIDGQPPLPEDFGTGCEFLPRCPKAAGVCAGPIPLRTFGSASVSCARAEEPSSAAPASQEGARP